MVKFYKPEAKKASPKHFSVVITDADIKGKGLGKKEDVTWFVSGALPGEEVVVRELSRKGNVGEAELINILKRSPERQEPVCQYFGKCGKNRYYPGIFLKRRVVHLHQYISL